VLSAWGTDGTSIYPLFNQPSTSLGKTVQSKLWADPGYFISKVARRLYGVVYYYSILSSAVTITLDNGSSSTQVLPISPLGTSQWTGAGGVAATWTGLGGVAATWTAVATAVFGPIGVSQPGPLIGLTLTTNAADMALLSLTVIEQTYSANV
jgi:hypothetical protein